MRPDSSTARAYTPVVRLALLSLLVTASLAAGEDWEARCREAAAGTPAARKAAVEALRRAGPDAHLALVTATRSDDADLASVAKLVLAARTWDPGARLLDIEPLRELESATRTGVEEAMTALCAAGAYRSGGVVTRLFERRPREERPGMLAILWRSPGRDPGWAEIAAAYLDDDVCETRIAAATAIRIHGNWRQGADLRKSIGRESDPRASLHKWTALIEISRGPEDLPPLPADPVLYHEVLGAMGADPERPRMCRAAWAAWDRRRTIRLPSSFGFDAQRLAARAGMESLEEAAERSAGLGDLGPLEATALAGSRSVEARGAVLEYGADSAGSFWRIAALLDDPDYSVRERAEGVLDDMLDAWEDESPGDRREKYRAFAAAARLALDLPLDSCAPEEVAGTVRALVEAGRASAATARLAIVILAGLGADGREALLELQEDPDLGAAAANARRILDLRLDGTILDFEEGLDSRPWLDWSEEGIDWERWRRAAESPDADDRWFAAALLFNAWDSILHRDEVRKFTLSSLKDDNADTAATARQFGQWMFPADLPDEEDLRPGDAWSRSRGYVLRRLRASATALSPLDIEQSRAIFDRGDRTLVLQAARAGRFASDEIRDLIRSAGEPGLLPLLLQDLSDGNVTNWQSWANQMAACGSDGCRLLGAVARTAEPQLRGTAIAALLASPWGFEAAAAPLEELSRHEGEDWEAALLHAMGMSGLAWRETPLPRRTADALAGALVRIADSGSPPERTRLLVRSLGRQSLRNATPDLLRDLASRPDLADAAVLSRAWIGPIPGIHEQAFRGATWMRGAALELLPGNRLELLRCNVLAWVETGSWREPIEPYRIGATWQEVIVALLDEAARDDSNREAILDQVALLRRYAADADPPATLPSMRIAEAPPHRAFAGESDRERTEAAFEFLASPDPWTFAQLSAAAFRGATGDEIALDAVAPRLGPEALPSLAPLLGNSSPRVRASAASAIARAAGAARPFALAALRAAATPETEESARLRILAALARLEDSSALDQLRAIAASPDPDRRLALTRALAWCPTRPAALILASLADDPDAVVRSEAHQELVTMTQRVNPAADPPFARAAGWRAWFEANPAAPLRDPSPRAPWANLYYEF